MLLALGQMNTYSLIFSLLQKVLATSTLKQRLKCSPIQEIPHSSLRRAAPEAQVSNLTSLEKSRKETGEQWVGGAAGGCCCCQPEPPAPAASPSLPRAPAWRWLPWPQRCVSLNASALLTYTKGRSFLHCTGNESMCFVKHTSLQLIFTLMLCLKVKIKKIKSYLTLVLTTRV